MLFFRANLHITRLCCLPVILLGYQNVYSPSVMVTMAEEIVDASFPFRVSQTKMFTLCRRCLRYTVISDNTPILMELVL